MNFVTAHSVAPYMGAGGGGVLLTVSTPGSRLSGVGHLGIGAASAAVEAFSRILADEVGDFGIRVICLRPSAIPGSLARLPRQGTLSRRLPMLGDFAEYAAFTASDRAGATTGAIANLTCGTLVD